MKPGYQTTEFWLTMLTNIVGALMASNLIMPDSKIAKILGVAAMVLSSLGYTYGRVSMKNTQMKMTGAVDNSPSDAKPGFINIGLAAVMSITVGVAVLVAACSGKNHVDPLGDVVDCLKADQGQIGSLESQLLPLLNGGSVNWADIEHKAEMNGAIVGGCALAEIVQQFLSSKKTAAGSDVVDQTWLAHDTFEHFRLTKANGATYKTKAGDL